MSKAEFKKDTQLAEKLVKNRIRLLEINKKMLKAHAVDNITKSLQAVENLVANEKMQLPPDAQEFVTLLKERTLKAIEKL
jgi:hypothetical protein